MKLRGSFIVTGAILLACCVQGLARDGSPVAATHMETGPELTARLTPEQKQQFDAAGKAFEAHRFAEAFTAFQSLLHDLPGDPLLSKFAGEAAINLGNAKFAVEALTSIAQANPADWQAVSLLTRAYAETGDKIHRDEGMTNMLALRQRGVTPPNLQVYELEQVKAGNRLVTIRTSLVPWSNYKVYDFAQVADEKGTIFMRISLESGDADQPGFAKEHPAEAAAGQRLFSIDAYRETGLNSAGQRTQTHYTFGFFTGQPSYDVVRDKFLEIATGKAAPISSRTGLTVQ